MPAPAAAPSLHGLSHAQLGAALASRRRRAETEAVWRALYRELHDDLAAAPGVDPATAAWLHAQFPSPAPVVARDVASADRLARKFLLDFGGGARIETVLMHYRGAAPSTRPADEAAPGGRYTACLSSQAGCAMGCVFCATGQAGFLRHLGPGEIVRQVVFLNRLLQPAGERVRNLVLMGMGEPLHNYDAVMQAVRVLTDPRGLALAPRHLTLSTVGVVPGIRRMTAERSPLRLAVSLHAATDAERDALVPAGRRWPLAELMAACRDYATTLRRKILFEWTLIAGRNDSPEQAAAVGRLLAGLPAHLNLIPLNPTGGYDGAASQAEAIGRFRAVLADQGVPSTVRQRRGIEVGAGCGQLRDPVP